MSDRDLERYPIEELVAYLERHRPPHVDDDPATLLAWALGRPDDVATLRKWVQRPRRITNNDADAIAVELGVMPWQIWPSWCEHTADTRQQERREAVDAARARAAA